MKQSFILCLLIAFLSCKDTNNAPEPNTNDISDISTKEFREFKVEDSKVLDVEVLWQPFQEDMKSFSEDEYLRLKPLIFDVDIPTIQSHIEAEKLSYEELVKFYLFRIKKYDRGNDKSLNSVLALNKNVIEEARARDNDKSQKAHPIFGMPILLKDNINTSQMPTTAGAVALLDNNTEDAFIVKQLKQKGAIILGKANLSEWAYFFCGDCPSGYSAVGGQTFNPYGRKTIDTGGSSSGSAVAVASNFCAAAIGSETSGSILSPASQNSGVGLKPTIGLVSRSGIVPISSTLDTAGPITKNVVDNAIVMDAIVGYDAMDSKSIKPSEDQYYVSKMTSVKGKRFAAFNRLMEDSLYVNAVNTLKSLGAEIIELDEQEVELPNFLRLLNLDMQTDLQVYFDKYGSENLTVSNVKEVIDFNNQDSLIRSPYGQKLFKGIVADSATKEEFDSIKNVLHQNGKSFFDIAFEAHQLDGFLSINNYHAGYAAVAEYPALTVPMGFQKNNEPKGLTFIAKPLQEKQLLNWALSFEQKTKYRKAPVNYN